MEVQATDQASRSGVAASGDPQWRGSAWARPMHPVTGMMHMMCFNRRHPIGERCLATFRQAGRRQS